MILNRLPDTYSKKMCLISSEKFDTLKNTVMRMCSLDGTMKETRIKVERLWKAAISDRRNEVKGFHLY